MIFPRSTFFKGKITIKIKGSADVEYENFKDAKQALEKMNGKIIFYFRGSS
jgi:RNA recognition motif-containing protein